MRRASRTRIAAGVIGMALMVALAGCGGQTSQAVATTSTTPTATLPPIGAATATPWPAGPGAWQAPTNCQSQPASYQTSYGANVDPPEQGAATTVSFDRADNCGATVKNLTLPKLTGVVYNTNVQDLSIFPSPISTRVAFLTIQTNFIVGSPACSTPATSATAMLHGGIDAAPESSYICQLQFVTSDSGATWQPLTLPVRGVLGQITPEANASLTMLGSVRPQGSRLYGMVTNAIMGSNATIPPGRLVASDDGGLTWKIADAALAAQGLGIWDFAPVPQAPVTNGSWIYVTAEPVNDSARQPPSNGATLSVWSSPDGGATWTRESDAPGSKAGKLVEAMLAGVTPDGKRTVYLMFGDKGVTTIVGSANDGAGWQGVGSLDITLPPSGMMGFPQIVGTLTNGAVVVINPYGDSTIMAWTPGSDPRAIAEGTALFPYWNPVLQQRSNGVYMWLMGEQGGPGLQIRYTQLRL